MKTLQIKNPQYEKVITNSRLKYITGFNSAVKKQEKSLNVTFFPEGGNFVVGLPIIMAFKAETNLGLPLEVKGIVVDNKGAEVVSFESIHDGMGTFKITPLTGNKYSAKITFADGKMEEYELPQASSSGLVMSVDPFGNEDIKVTLKPNGLVSTNSESTGIIIMAQSGGQINYIVKGKINNKQVISSIPKKVLSVGINQITLFDDRGEPICERLVFIQPEQAKNAAMVNLTAMEKDDSIICHIKVSPSGGKLSTGNVSLSVTEILPNTETSVNTTILTSLLLTSDIKGRVNNPAYYFNIDNPNRAKHLDLIMLTNGWRRFVWKDLMADKFPEISYSREGGISISGSVYDDNFSRPLSNNKVVLSIPSEFNFKFETNTDNKGKFEFPVLEYNDTVYVKIETVKSSDGKSGYIVLDQSLPPNSDTYPYPVLYSENYDKEKLKENTKRDNLERKNSPQIKSSREPSVSSSYGSPTSSFKVGQEAQNFSNVFQYISGRITGVEIQGNSIIIRGARTFMGNSDALLILDGVPVDASTLNTMTPNDLDRIEVFKGPETASFGSQGANGVLVFYSKQGNIPKRSSVELYLAGYHKTRAFYIPPYESWTIKPESIEIPRTIYWNPNVDINEDGEAVVRFKKIFSSDKLNITLEGLTDSGEIVYSRTEN
jgi:hypothetical protein